MHWTTFILAILGLLAATFLVVSYMALRFNYMTEKLKDNDEE